MNEPIGAPAEIAAWVPKLQPIPAMRDWRSQNLAPEQPVGVFAEQREAAVLVLLHGDPGDPAIVFVRKSVHLKTHSGQVAFPGGTIEPDDTSISLAALREAREEAGIKPDSVVILGMLPIGRVVRSRFEVFPVVGWWECPGELCTNDPGEISAIHVISVNRLLAAKNRVTWVHPLGHTGPGFVAGDLFIWGFTAGILDQLFNLAGWTKPWDESRIVQIPRAFFRERR